MSDPQVTLKFSSNTLKDINFEVISLGKFILETNSLEKLHLEKCTFDVFEIVGKGRLRHLEIEDVRVNNLYIHESAENLEVVDVSNFTIKWAEFYHMISRSSKLRTIRLWGVMCDTWGRGC
ncbi:F-box/LRR-repeat protein [Abeliophyllum distichum]|uniref:F-box/LRR-repeat protein n=1 Tax=Abeliophyllum distichum TaxID=126358 RepID=A0ABD1RFF8_9LAMI